MCINKDFVNKLLCTISGENPHFRVELSYDIGLPQNPTGIMWYELRRSRFGDGVILVSCDLVGLISGIDWCDDIDPYVIDKNIRDYVMDEVLRYVGGL